MIRLVALLSCVLVCAVAPTAIAQDDAHGVREFTESGTWRVPPGVARLTIELWGAGGGGAGGASAAVSSGPGGGGGGGSGAYLRASVGVREGETYTINIGAAGAGGRGEGRQAAEAGGDGKDTVIVRDGKVLLVASGGRGGSAPKFGGVNGGPGGAGGLAKPLESVLVRSGNSGGPGDTGGSAEWNSTAGGRGGTAVLGTLQPPGSFGGAGGAGMHFGYSEDGKPGASGSALITW